MRSHIGEEIDITRFKIYQKYFHFDFFSKHELCEFGLISCLQKQPVNGLIMWMLSNDISKTLWVKRFPIENLIMF